MDESSKQFPFVMHYHTRQIFDHPPLTETALSADINRLVEIVSKHFQTLKRLYSSCETLDASVTWSIFSKLNSDMRQKWETFLNETATVPSWKTMQQFLISHIE